MPIYVLKFTSRFKVSLIFMNMQIRLYVATGRRKACVSALH